MTVRFVSDSSNIAAGFKFVFNEVSVACGGQLMLTRDVTEGHFTSPNYPHQYPPNVDCVWVISSPGHTAVQLDFEGDFSLEADLQ